MSRLRITIYCIIAVAALFVGYLILAPEPHPDWPINLVHFLFKH
ncbi:hypothetical protein [Geomonas ferrireducens]|nr:hypothetical protein [Geomonas ferrireducens]